MAKLQPTVCLNVQQFVQFVVAHCFTTDSTGFMAKVTLRKKRIEPPRCTCIYIYIIIYFVFFQNLFLEQIAFQHFVMIFHFVSLYAAAAVRGTSFGCAVVPFAAWSFKAIQYGKGHSICQGIGVQGRSLKVTEA